MNLLCLSDFNQEGIVAKAGEVRWFPLGVVHRLVDSWPACWQPEPITIEVKFDAPEVETEAIDAPPVDKMMRKAKAKRRG